MKFKIKKVKAAKEMNREGEPFLNSTKIYIWPFGETLEENLMNRGDRPHEFYQQHILHEIIAQAREQFPELKISNNVGDYIWHRNCGCSMCSCSPGFVHMASRGSVTVHADVEFYQD